MRRRGDDLSQQKETRPQPEPLPRHIEGGPAIAPRNKNGCRRDQVPRDEEPECTVEEVEPHAPIAATQAAPGPNDSGAKPELDDPKRVPLRRRFRGDKPPHDDKGQDQHGGNGFERVDRIGRLLREVLRPLCHKLADRTFSGVQGFPFPFCRRPTVSRIAMTASVQITMATTKNAPDQSETR